MKNAFDILTKASAKNNVKTDTSPKSPVKTKQSRKTRSTQKLYSENLSDSESSPCQLSPDGKASNTRRVKRIRKRASRVAHKYEEDEDDFDELASPKRQKTENTFSGKSFSLGDDESILQPKPKKVYVSKQLASINNNGVVPSLFKDINQRKAELRAQKESSLKQSMIVLPKSIANVTAKEIDRLAGQIMELDPFSFPCITSVETKKEKIKPMTGYKMPIFLQDLAFDAMQFLQGDLSLESIVSTVRADTRYTISIRDLSEDDSRECVKNLESKHRDFSIRPMLRRFLVHQDWSNKLYSDMFSASFSEDILGLKSHAENFANWLITYSMATNKVLEVLRKRRTEDAEEEQLLLNAESTCVAIVSGPPGIGKTSFVKSVAADQNYKVVEVNTSQCRSQKHIIAQLKDGLIAQKMASGESETKSLILVDDADVVLADDSNFIQAICTLAQMSHKPVVLTVANEEALSGVRVSCKKFNLPKDRTQAVETLLECICITKRKTVNEEVISKIAEKNNFHYALNGLQTVLENEIYGDNFKVPYSYKTEISEVHEDLCEQYEKKLSSRFEEVESQTTQAEMELELLSKKLEMRAFSTKYNFTTFSVPNCQIWPGDTTKENSATAFQYECRPKIESPDDEEIVLKFDEITNSYQVNTCRSWVDRFAQFYPYLGTLAIEDEKNKLFLESKDQRKVKRYCHYFDSPCNLGFSDSLKGWISEFYSFDDKS